MVLLALTCAIVTAPLRMETALVAHDPIVLPTQGGFDYMYIDSGSHRLFATHGGANKLTTYDLKSGEINELDAEAVNGVTVDAKGGKVFAAGGGKKLYVWDRKTLAPISNLDLPGEADDIEFNPKNGMLYIDNDNLPNVWIYNPSTGKLGDTIHISGIPEFLEYCPATEMLYQNIKDKNVVDVIDPKTNQVTASWPTGGETSPHGLAIDHKTHHVFSAGKNGILNMMDIHKGAIISSVAIANGVDQIVFDATRRRIYSACNGAISISQETKEGLKSLGDVPAPKGSHTITVDESTGDVWICYSDADHGYIKRYSLH